MATLQFTNLGPTPGSNRTHVFGDLYVLMLEEKAIIFDTRIYKPKTRRVMHFEQVGPFQFPVLPPLRSRSLLKATELGQVFPAAIKKVLGLVTQAYVVNISGQSPTLRGWRWLTSLFPNASMANVPIGRTDWNPFAQDDSAQPMIETIEKTGLVQRGEKTKIGENCTLFFFESKDSNSTNVLVLGQIKGLGFTFFFGEECFGKFFSMNQVSLEPNQIHWLSPGAWHSFYSLSTASEEETYPVKALAAE